MKTNPKTPVQILNCPSIGKKLEPAKKWGLLWGILGFILQISLELVEGLA